MVCTEKVQEVCLCEDTWPSPCRTTGSSCSPVLMWAFQWVVIQPEVESTTPGHEIGLCECVCVCKFLRTVVTNHHNVGGLK